MVDKDKLANHLQQLNNYISELESLKNLSKEDYLSDNRNIFTLRYLFQVSIETCINMGSHIVSRNNLGIPGEYADVFRILNSKGIISKNLELSLIQMVRFRNRLVHLYWEIDDELIYDYLRDYLKDFYLYIDEIHNFIGLS